jgi:hypothetical protein
MVGPKRINNWSSRHSDWISSVKRERKQLQIPADPRAVKQLAAYYRSEQLGDLVVHRTGGNVEFALVDGWKSAMATRKNDDSTMSFVGISPTLRGWEFAVGDRDDRAIKAMQVDW